MNAFFRLAVFALLTCLSFASWGDSFPSRPVRIMVPFPPGGIADSLARAVGDKLGPQLGQPVIVENRPGGNTIIGAQVVAKANPDGLTLLMGTDATLSVLPFIYKKLPFDPQRDFRPVVPIVHATSFLAVSADLPVHSVADLVKLAKAKPGALSYASQGQGSNGHISGEMFRKLAGVDITHVPYKGLFDAVNSLVAGDKTSMTFANVYAMAPFVRAGKIRLLAVMGDRRSPLYPDVPTIAEVGLGGMESVAWFGLVAPVQTPRDVVDKLATQVHAILQDPAFRERYITGVGLEPAPQTTPDEFSEFLVQDRKKYESQVRQTGIRLD